MGFGTCIAFAIIFYSRRRHRTILHADWRFTCVFIAGCALLNLFILTLLGYNTDAYCMLRMWSFHGLFPVALSPLFVKIWRIKQLVGRSTNFRRMQISNSETALLFLPMIAIEAFFLMNIHRRPTERKGYTGQCRRGNFACKCLVSDLVNLALLALILFGTSSARRLRIQYASALCCSSYL